MTAPGFSEEDYIAQRLDDQIGWLDRKSQTNQRSYKGLRLLEISLAASIPFLVGYVTEARPVFAVLVGLAGVMVAVISGVLALNQHQENWVSYRTTCEALRQHKYRYLTRAHPYDQDDGFGLLVENVESLLSKENSAWSKNARTQPPKPAS